MTCVFYKEYQGLVCFEDDHLVVKIMHIEDSISTIFDSAKEAEEVFKELVDDYILTCEEIGKDPCKPHKGSFNVRVTPETHRQIAMAAVEAGESLNSWVSQAIERQLRNQKEKVSVDYASAYAVMMDSLRLQQSKTAWDFAPSIATQEISIDYNKSLQRLISAIQRPHLHG